MFTSLQFYAVWLILVGVIAGSVARRQHRQAVVRQNRYADYHESRRHLRWRRRRLRARRSQVVATA